jgi:hypothetical protein
MNDRPCLPPTLQTVAPIKTPRTCIRPAAKLGPGRGAAGSNSWTAPPHWPERGTAAAKCGNAGGGLRVVRTLIDKIVVRVGNNALDLVIRWHGGDHSGTKQHSIVQRLLNALRAKAAENLLARESLGTTVVIPTPGAVDGSGYRGPDPPTAPLIERVSKSPRCNRSITVGLSPPTAPLGFSDEAIRGVKIGRRLTPAAKLGGGK